uniref:Uncharacterized protein n=1 Tax=uncultured bacterium 9F08 TaxID=697051 RepID=D2XIT4_9BACT|nr:hypothetical protein [uncultured bacterium 9F08]
MATEHSVAVFLSDRCALCGKNFFVAADQAAGRRWSSRILLARISSASSISTWLPSVL